MIAYHSSQHFNRTRRYYKVHGRPEFKKLDKEKTWKEQGGVGGRKMRGKGEKQ